mgnify:CR=1 FL=1
MDKYTKCILTIIAVSLVSISFQLSKTNLVDIAYAKGDCGEKRYNACYVKIVD